MLGDASDAEDATQDAFVQAWRKLAGFRADAAFSTWMYRIVTNRCRNLLRARRRTEPLPEDREAPASRPGQPLGLEPLPGAGGLGVGGRGGADEQLDGVVARGHLGHEVPIQGQLRGSGSSRTRPRAARWSIGTGSSPPPWPRRRRS
jgi:RNA polymerase sigma-70 factor (ECF subfamily)